MEKTWNYDNGAADYALLEKVNPVFNTAKMTLFQLAANGDANAAVLAKQCQSLRPIGSTVRRKTSKNSTHKINRLLILMPQI